MEQTFMKSAIITNICIKLCNTPRPTLSHIPDECQFLTLIFALTTQSLQLANQHLFSQGNA